MKEWILRKIKRTKLRFYLWSKNLAITPTFEEEVATYEKIAFKICLKCISHKDSDFMIDPITNKRYISNETLDIFLSIDSTRVDITNHVYHYNVKMSNRDWSRLTFIYDKEANKRRVDMENQVNSQIQNSLHDVLEKISVM
jgi:hypothetical protein